MRHKQQNLLNQNIQHLENYIKDHQLDINPEEMILTITEADPDCQKFKNSKWLINNLLNNNFLWEDIEAGKQSKAFDTLSRFLNIRKQWSDNAIKDIQAYKGLSGIAEAIRPFEITKSMGELKREEKAKIYSETIVVYDKDNYLVVIPKTEEASCYWGRNTEWCTASTKSANYFDAYNPDGPLIIAITPDNKKYQFHINSSPMDENDKLLKNITDPILVELALLTKNISYIKAIDYTNPRHCKLVVQQDIVCLRYMSPNRLVNGVSEYLKICKQALQYNGCAIRYIPVHTENYFELCKIAVQNNGYAIAFISSEIEDYFELCKLAVQQNGLAIRDIPPNNFTLNHNFELCKLAVQQNGLVLGYMPTKNLMNTQSQTAEYSNFCIKDIMIELYFLAVQQNGTSIQYISPETKGYQELCNRNIINELYFLAVQNNGTSIIYISPDTENYIELCKLAIPTYPEAIQAISPKDEDYFKLCKLAVQEQGYSLKYMSPENFSEENYLEICRLALKKYNGALICIPKKYKEILQEEIKIPLKPTIEILNTTDWLKNKEYENIIDNFNQLGDELGTLTLKQNRELS